MRILVTNDDGYDAPGLSAAAPALIEAGHDVIVAAPLTERSGSGSSLGSIEDGTHIPVLSTSLPGLAHAGLCLRLPACAGRGRLLRRKLRSGTRSRGQWDQSRPQHRPVDPVLLDGRCRPGGSWRASAASR